MVKSSTRRQLTVVLVALACLQASCATPVRPDHLAQSDRRSLGRVAIVAARYQPQYQFDAIVAGKGQGAARGALGGVGVCAQAGSGGGWAGGLLFIVCAPIGATAGAISGAVAAAPAQQVEAAKGSAQRGIEALELQEITLAAVQRYAKDEGLDLAQLPEAMGPAKPADALSYAEAKDLADTVIEIAVLNAKAATTGSKDLRVGLGMVARVRVLSVRDGKELDTFTIRASGGLRTVDEWLATTAGRSGPRSSAAPRRSRSRRSTRSSSSITLRSWSSSPRAARPRGCLLTCCGRSNLRCGPRYPSMRAA